MGKEYVMNFLEQIKKRAKSSIKTIVLPESTDFRVLKAAATAQNDSIANIVLIGEEDNIKRLAGDLDISNVRIVNPTSCDKYEEYVNTFYEIRKSKGMTIRDAEKIIRDPLYFGVMMVKTGEADGMVAGAINATSDTLRPALQILKTAPGTKLVSSFFVMVVPDQRFGYNGTFIYSDCGLVENPDAEQLSEIAVSSSKSFRDLVKGEPKVAMLSYSTHGSAQSELTDKVIKAVKIAREKAPDLILDGELQVDAAIIPSVGQFKAPGSSIKGDANILVFPDLNCGNIAYKLTQRLAKAEAYGPITHRQQCHFRRRKYRRLKPTLRTQCWSVRNSEFPHAALSHRS